MQHLRAAIIGSFVGDSFNLAPHWNYNITKLERTYGRLTDFVELPENTYHPQRESGDFTHYGDQARWLLDSVARHRSFDAERFSFTWQEQMMDFDGYRDGASTETLENFRSGRRLPSASNDLAGITRMAGLLLADNLKDEQDLVDAARDLTAITHGDAQVIDAAEFFMRLLVRVQAGESISNAVRMLSHRQFAALPAAEWIEKARALPEMSTPKALMSLGQTCHVDHAFPATVYVLLKHGHSFEEAMIENAMAGGDNAARGMILGLILGAVHGREAIPTRWASATHALPEVEALLDATLPVHRFGSVKFDFKNVSGDTLSGRLETPEAEPRGVVLFAHCFTCGKEIAAAARVTRKLADRGMAVLRFDFTGIGNSDGDFSNSNFSSSVSDLFAAASALEEHVGPVDVLMGHSLGGAAVLAAAGELESVKAVVTVGAPSNPGHVRHLLGEAEATLQEKGEAEVSLAGRRFTFRKQFLDDLEAPGHTLGSLPEEVPVLLLHAPEDHVVGYENAQTLLATLPGTPSLVSLHGADHLLTQSKDAERVASLASAWLEPLL